MKILIAEDDGNMRDMLKMAFENNNFSVDVASDGEIALSKAQDGDHDIILLDLMLPKKIGFEVISELRDQGVETPIMVISGALDAENREKAFALGADDFLVKNFSIIELLGRVKNCINKEPDILECEKLTLNIPKKEVDIDGKKVSLTYAEFEILFKLLSNKHAIVNEDDMNKVGFCSLLGKIGDDVVEYVEGFGYMISK
ncbi:MAG: response regulator transcription factor [Candidatus Peregrinibacteria bacterium]|nr:response regulator transcription factor [Candidatus Peregrinibacteria bacterium]